MFQSWWLTPTVSALKVAPISMDRTNPNHLVTGGARVWNSAAGRERSVRRPGRNRWRRSRPTAGAAAVIAAAAGRRVDQAAPLMWKGTVTMLLATPMALRSSAFTVPSLLTSGTASGASL